MKRLMILAAALAAALFARDAAAQCPPSVMPQNSVLAGPASGAPGQCTARGLAAADLPSGFTCPAGFTASILGCTWTQTASSSASLQWTGLANNEYELDCSNLLQATTTVALYLQFGEGGTPTWETADYAWATAGQNSGGNSTSGHLGGTDSGLNLTDSLAVNTANYGVSFWIRLHALATSGVEHAAEGPVNFAASSAAATATPFGGRYVGDTNAITAVQLLSGGGNLSSGSCTLRYVGPS
jgi:hypothetical protein